MTKKPVQQEPAPEATPAGQAPEATPAGEAPEATPAGEASQPLDSGMVFATLETVGVERLGAWPKSVRPEDQDPAAEQGIRARPEPLVLGSPASVSIEEVSSEAAPTADD